MIHDAEMDVEVVRVDVEKARNNLAQLRLALRDKRAEFQGKGRRIGVLRWFKNSKNNCNSQMFTVPFAI